jgi:hypothetical protein
MGMLQVVPNDPNERFGHRSQAVAAKHRGAAAELVAAMWLWQRGFEVFQNLSPAGPADLVAWNPGTGETLLIDVKGVQLCEWRTKAGVSRGWYASKEASVPGVRLLYVYDDGVVSWELRGLET